MDNEANSKVSQAIAIFTLLCFVYACSPPLRYVCLKLEHYARWQMRRILRELRHMADPAWKRELADRNELFVWPQVAPSWWLHINPVKLGDGADASVPTAPSE
jgi:hypothetical protein